MADPVRSMTEDLVGPATATARGTSGTEGSTGGGGGAGGDGGTDWNDLVGLWQGGAQDATPAVDAKKLAREVRARTWRMRGWAIVELVCTAIGILIGWDFIARAETQHEIAVGVLIIVAVIVVQAACFWARRGTWSGKSGTARPAQLLDLQIGRARSDIVYAKLNYPVLAVTLALLFFMFAPGLIAGDLTRMQIQQLAGLYVTLIVGVIGGTEWYLRRRRAALAALRELRAQIAADDPGEADRSRSGGQP